MPTVELTRHLVAFFPGLEGRKLVVPGDTVPVPDLRANTVVLAKIAELAKVHAIGSVRDS